MNEPAIRDSLDSFEGIDVKNKLEIIKSVKVDEFTFVTRLIKVMDCVLNLDYLNVSERSGTELHNGNIIPWYEIEIDGIWAADEGKRYIATFYGGIPENGQPVEITEVFGDEPVRELIPVDIFIKDVKIWDDETKSALG